MNQKQANRVVEALDYFENLNTKEFDLDKIGETEVEINCDIYEIREKLEGILMELDHFEHGNTDEFEVPAMSCYSKIGECPSVACFCGHMPFVFPEVFQAVIADKGIMGAEYGYPNITPPKDCTIRVYGKASNAGFYVDFFGLPYEDIVNMVSDGYRPNGYDKYSSDLKAVIQYLKDQLDKNGYEIVNK